jgi:hypothetical protein
VKVIRILLCLWLVSVSINASAVPVSTAFTYQGELKEMGAPANGTFDMEFRLFDAEENGSDLGTVAKVVTVSQGQFLVELDFGASPFTGDQLWLEITLTGPQPNVPEEGVVMLPRQKLTASPYAVQALSVTPGSIASGDIEAGAVGSEQIADASVAAEDIAAGAIGVTKIDPAQVQSRVTPGCAAGEFIRAVSENGTPICAPDEAGGSGTVTQVDTGTGLTGGPIVGSGTIAVDTSVVQRRVADLCPAGLLMIGVAENGSPLCDVLPKEKLVNTINEPDSYNAIFTMDMVLDADGFPVIAYRENNPSDIVLVTCNDVACSGNDETFSTTFGGGTNYLSLVIGADGFPMISYYQPEETALWVMRCNDVACSGANEIVYAVDSGGTKGEYNSMTVPEDGFPVMSYTDGEADDLKVAKCTDKACSLTKTKSVVHSECNDVRHTSITIGSDGFPVISYSCNVPGTGSGLWVAKCNDPACSGDGETLSFVDDDGDVYETSIVIGDDGFPVISYRGFVNQTLKVAKCNDLACSGDDETITVVDDRVNELAFYSNTIIGADGFPIVAYWELTASVLRIARCNDAACSGGNETLAVVDDPANQVGRFLRMQLGQDGLPVILYEDLTSGKLKLARCGTSDCRD